MAGDIDIASCVWSTDMFPYPTEKFNVSQMGTLAKNSGYLCHFYDSAMSGICILDEGAEHDYNMINKLALEAGTYEFQCSIYSMDGVEAEGSISVDGTAVLEWMADGTAPDWTTGSTTIVLEADGRVDVEYLGSRLRNDSEHYIWVGYKRLFDGTA